MLNVRCAYAQLKRVYDQLEVCTCITGYMHMLYWRCARAHLKMYMCSTKVYMLPVIVYMHQPQDPFLECSFILQSLTLFSQMKDLAKK